MGVIPIIDLTQGKTRESGNGPAAESLHIGFSFGGINYIDVFYTTRKEEQPVRGGTVTTSS